MSRCSSSNDADIAQSLSPEGKLLAHPIGMMTGEPISLMTLTDADLVAQTLAGNRDAFRQIVERYKNLICSLAYSATGNMGRSEDVAQETFIVAWTHLHHLHEPQKLRAWLCGIMRNRVRRNARNDVHEPVHAAESLDVVENVADGIPTPVDHVISNEEKAILWRSLEKIPEIYREPLVLFYREHQSIVSVAHDLELSEDAVKQRLSRGRKMLQEEVLALVEGTLERTAPDASFSIGVMGALPMLAMSGATASVAVGAKGSAAVKSGFLSAVLAPLTPFFGILAGIGAQWLMIRETTSDRKLRLKRILFVVIGWVVYLGLFIAGEHAMGLLCRRFDWHGSASCIAWATYYWLFLSATLAVLIVVMAARTKGYKGNEIPEIVAPPMKSSTLAGIVAGLELMFSWLLWIAWRMHDLVGVATIAGAFIIVGVTTFFCAKGKTGLALKRAFRMQSMATGAVVLLALNFRVHTWISFATGMALQRAYNLLPMWVVPTFSVALVLWTLLMVRVAALRKSVARNSSYEV